MLSRYYQHYSAGERETVWTERTVQHRYERFVLFGKIDRLDRMPDGSLEVVDYKSGRRSVTEDEVRDSLALTIYQLLVARNHPGVPVSAGILALRTCEYAAVSRGDTELEAAEREVVQLVHTILDDERFAPLPGEQCRECVYPRICPAGRQWLREHPHPSVWSGDPASPAPESTEPDR